MSQTKARLALSVAEQAKLAKLLEREGDVALSARTRLARQTLARAVAGFALNSESRETLQAYLAA